MSGRASSARAFCTQCGTAVASADRFCPACGSQVHRPATARRREAPPSTRRRRGLDDRAERATRALAVVFIGVSAGIGGLWLLDLDELPLQMAFAGVEIGVGTAALAALGPGAWRASFAGRATGRWLAAAIGVACATVAVSLGYVHGLAALVDVEAEAEPVEWTTLLSAVVIAPALEEWLFRGVQWRALEPFTTAPVRNATAAVSFGLLHCLDGLLGFPHRFVAGLGFGWLRERSGSLVPAVLAHALHNLLAIATLS